jgi:2-dehydro-3-deoxyphosphogluconate aldolase/(4S)-4-hydroxy-2-oxoglutarate aldolase
VRDYLAEEIVLACGGSWIAQRDRIAAADWDHITATARAAAEAVHQARGQ